jgi:hypothetical protein
MAATAPPYLGHDAGDRLLLVLVEFRLRGVMREERRGGDQPGEHKHDSESLLSHGGIPHEAGAGGAAFLTFSGTGMMTNGL